jgi:hypothetical protein
MGVAPESYPSRGATPQGEHMKGHYAGKSEMIDTQKPWLAAPALMHVIKNYDDKLLIYWDKSINMYCIARNGEMGLHFIAPWPLPLDTRLLHTLRMWDLRPPILDAPKNATETGRLMTEAEDARAAKADQNFADDLHHATMDNRQVLEKTELRRVPEEAVAASIEKQYPKKED